MSHRLDPRDAADTQRAVEDIPREVDQQLGGAAGDPRWGTGGMWEGERSYPAHPAHGDEPVAPQARGRVEGPRLGQRSRGPYAGRAPRGYRRSDDRIREDVCERFTDDGDLDPSDVEVGVDAGEVTLLGTVETRSQKRLAEDIADAVFGVVEVHNRLRVRTTTPPPVERLVDAVSASRRG